MTATAQFSRPIIVGIVYLAAIVRFLKSLARSKETKHTLNQHGSYRKLLVKRRLVKVMPDILIRGMEMPTMEQAYKTLIISYDGKVYEGVHPQPTAKKKEPIAEAVELPPHGDLIDVSKISLREYEQAADDALHNGKGSILYDCGVLAGARAITQFVRRAPVIVPAERRKSGE